MSHISYLPAASSRFAAISTLIRLHELSDRPSVLHFLVGWRLHAKELPMRLEIAICTWNRAATLDKTLTAFRRLKVPQDVRWEVLVVNNNCSDATDDVISHHARHLPIRRLFEPRPGLSHARNCAAKAARGELLLWTDDDVLVDSQWLTAYINAVRLFPGASFLGGPIAPWFEVPPPAWLAAMLTVPGVSGAFALRDLGDRSFRIDANNLHELPYGANFAIRTHVQKHYLYDTTLGRTKTNMVSGEETSLLTEMVAAGHHGVWVPDAGVQHFIPKERATIEFLRAFFVGLGRTTARTTNRSANQILPRLWIEVCYAEFMYRLHWFLMNHRKSAQHLIHGGQLWGQLLDCIQGGNNRPGTLSRG